MIPLGFLILPLELIDCTVHSVCLSTSHAFNLVFLVICFSLPDELEFFLLDLPFLEEHLPLQVLPLLHLDAGFSAVSWLSPSNKLSKF